MLSLSIKLDFYGCLKSHYQDPWVLYGEVLNRFQDASLPILRPTHNLRELKCPNTVPPRMPLRFLPERPAWLILQYSRNKTESSED